MHPYYQWPTDDIYSTELKTRRASIDGGQRTNHVRKVACHRELPLVPCSQEPPGRNNKKEKPEEVHRFVARHARVVYVAYRIHGGYGDELYRIDDSRTLQEAVWLHGTTHIFFGLLAN